MTPPTLVIACAFAVAFCCGGLRAQVTILNPSFELGTQVNSSTGYYSQVIPVSTFSAAVGTLSNWTATASTVNAAAGNFYPTPGGSNWTTKEWDGNSIGYLQVNGAGTATMSQTLPSTLLNDTIYSVVFGHGRRQYTPRHEIEVEVFAGSQQLLSFRSTDETAPRSYWQLEKLSFSSGANNSHAGESLQIVISVTGKAGILTEAFFDSIELRTSLSPTAVPSVKQGGVAPVFSTATTIQPGSWISIFGSNFIAEPAIWKNDFPTTLGGVKVTINNKPAYIWYVSRNQINVQAPLDTATGAVTVIVTTPQGTASGAVTLGPYGPSFSLLDEKHAAAIVLTPGPGNSGGGYDIVGPAGTSLGYPTRPVKAGETIVLYGVGFGPTNPPTPSGVLFYGAAACLETPKFTIGGVPAIVNFAGVVSAGLYQFNVVVPGTASGDQPLQAIVGGLTTPPIAVVSIQ